RLTTLAGVIQVDAAGGDITTPSGGTINGTIQNNNIWNDSGFINGRRAIDVQVEMDSHNLGQLAVAITNNTVNNVQGNAIHVSVVSVGGGNVTDANWTITGNSLGAAGTNNGIRVGLDNTDSSSAIEFETNVDLIASSNAQLVNKLLVSNNVGVNSADNATGGTLDITNIGSSGASGSATLNATVTNNTLTNVDTAGTGHVLDVLNSSASSHETLNLNITGNNTTLGASTLGQIRLRQLAGTFNIQGGVAAVSANNSGDTVSTTGSFGTVASVLTPTAPSFLIYALGGIYSARAMFPLVQAFDATGYSTAMAPALSSPISNVSNSISQSQLDSIVNASIQRWAATGLTAQQLATLHGIKFDVADLGGSYIGESDGNRILVDRSAQGLGWLVVYVSLSDSLFNHAISTTRSYTDAMSAPAGHLDLLTAIEHEMGHKLGLSDSYAEKDRDNLMYGYLTVGERRLPAPGQARNAKVGNSSGSHFLSLASPRSEQSQKFANQAVGKRNAPMAHALTTASSMLPVAPPFPVSIGTIPVGKSVNVTFQVTLNNPLPGGTTQVSSQGTVSGSNFSNVLTDDPAAAGASDPTVTLVATSISFVVNTLGDAADLSLDGVCDTDAAAGNQCTLRAAIQETNGASTDDSITFDPALNGGTITLDTALDAISGNLTITGPGATLLTVGRNPGAATKFRIFTINSGKTVSISGLTIANGTLNPGSDGGGVLNNGTLTLTGCNLYGNSTALGQSGGGIYSDGPSLTLSNCNIGGTAAGQPNSAITRGGGIFNNSGTLTVTGGTISGNIAGSTGGGGVYVAGGSASLTNVAMVENHTFLGSGGAISTAAGTTTLANCLLS
ncbi:MAG: hypothetical protein QOJ58_5244, partial [Alphaproteobacteria bacterium]|nr:hypothetical protein [Alphaproteobacteria bacterium]